jgi:hypothetical protein
MWWSNNEQRRQQKERIKNIIKRTKLNEKAAHTVPLSTHSPPSLCHSTLTAETFSDGFARTRGGSLDSQFSDEFDFSCAPQGVFSSVSMPPLNAPFHPYGTAFPPPYEVDIKTETQVFVNDVPTRRDSTISTFSAFQTPPTAGPFSADGWLQQESYFEHRHESFTEEPVDFNFFDFAHDPISPAHKSMIQVDECDQHLLNHFIDNVVRLIFPVLEVNQHGSARSDVILPALESNKTYLSCCLSISALHLKTTQGIQSEQLDNDIMRHKFATINQLCEALQFDSEHAKILEATLGMIFFQCSVGRSEDSHPDIAWHSHFQAATQLINKLELPFQLVNDTQSHPPFNMTVAAWIDILGATMLGRAPIYADTYREKNISNSVAGLGELMGCEDRIMFLISEIACLEALKTEGMDQVQLCSHIKLLGDHITMAETGVAPLENAYSATGAIRPKQLRSNMTTVFRLAARIYLCSLVPGFDRQQPNITNLVDTLADAMNYIPAGAEGFDRSLVWPLLIAGSASLPNSPFRTIFYERMTQMGDAASFGSIGRARELLREVWHANDEVLARGERQSVHWRDVMQQRGWDFLLI